MGRKKTYDRKEVLDKALDLFWKKGFEGAHLQELVDVTNLNRFSLYKEFGGKDGLFEEAIDQYLGDLQEMGQSLQREPRGLNNILDYIHQVTQSDFSYGCFMINTLTQKALIQERINKRVAEFIAKSEHALLDNLLVAQKNSEIDPELDVQALAKFLVVFDIGFVTYSLLGPNRSDKEGLFNVLKGLLTKS